MQGQIIAQGRRGGKTGKHKRTIAIYTIIAILLMVIGLVTSISDATGAIETHKHTKYCYKYEYRSDFNKDNKNNNLQSFKMDCDYINGPVALGISRYMDGGFVLPMLIFIFGITVGMIKRARTRGYAIDVTNEAVKIVYSATKKAEFPIRSVFTVEKVGEKQLDIVTSENTYKLPDMIGRDEVYTAIEQNMPKISITGPANTEQVLAKGYPNAVKPWLLVLTILLALASLITAISTEEFGAFAVGLIPTTIVFIFYLLAKTPYLVVTDKRVFCVSDFGRKLSIPLNKVTVVVTHRWFKQLHIAAPTGRMHLFGVRNTAQLYDAINALLNEKQ